MLFLREAPSSALTSGLTRSNTFLFYSNLQKYIIIIIIYYFHIIYSGEDTQKPDKGPFLPFEIHNLYETSLLTLVGCGKLPKDFCGDEVHKKLRLKFHNAMTHTKNKLQKVRNVSYPSKKLKAIFIYYKIIHALIF